MDYEIGKEFFKKQSEILAELKSCGTSLCDWKVGNGSWRDSRDMSQLCKLPFLPSGKRRRRVSIAKTHEQISQLY